MRLAVLTFDDAVNDYFARQQVLERLQTADLLPYLQSKSKISEIMNRKRPLSLSMIRALHDGLKIPAAVLMQESAAPTTRNRSTNLRRKSHRRSHPVAA